MAAEESAAWVAEAVPEKTDWTWNFAIAAAAASYGDSFLEDRWNGTADQICRTASHRMTWKNNLKEERFWRDVRGSLMTKERAKVCHKSLWKRRKVGQMFSRVQQTSRK